MREAPTVITDSLTGRRINLLDWKAANIRYSYLLGLIVFVLLAAIAYLLAQAVDPASALLFVGIALGIAGVQNIVAYWFSDQIALNITGARKATISENRYLVNITEAVAMGAGLPMPKLYVIDSPAPNAFATGRNPANSSVAITTGLLEILDRQELEAVIAHELAHIKNFDILFMSMLAATVGAILVLKDLIFRSMRYGRRRSNSSNSKEGPTAVFYILLLVLLVLAPLLASLLRLAVSRRREFLADATGAYITRNPEGMASALEKLRDYKGEALNVSEGVRHMFFTNPIKQFNAAAAFATHPPLEDRINRLRRM